MSQQRDSSSKNTASLAAIKIAAKEADQRHSGGGADPGPGDPSAAPSEAPQLVDIPEPPTSSQLVVKSTSSKQTTNLPTLNEGRSGTGPSIKGSGPKSIIQASLNQAHAGTKSISQLGPAASNPSQGGGGAPREPTSSRALTGVPDSNVGQSGTGPKSMGKLVSGQKSATGSPMTGASKSATGAAGKSSSAAAGGASSPMTASTAMQADSGVVHDEDEEGEGELEHPDGEASPTSPATAPMSGPGSGPKSAGSNKSLQGKSSSAAASGPGPSGLGISSMMNDMKSGPSGSSPKGGKKNKVTKFRYHKRIVVRTKGSANPSNIMDKVNKKSGNARITPSTIEDMDPQELMKRAGIKGTNKTHWRVRLRQTKRLTKNGKTTTQTKVAYRDSEGNKRVKTSLSPNCKNCGKKLEECKCESNSES